MIFIFAIYPVIVAKDQVVAIKYQHLVTWLVFYLSNFSVLFLTPAVENSAKVFNCRDNDTIGKFISKFAPKSLICYEKEHWFLVLFAFLLVLPFAYGLSWAWIIVQGTMRYTRAFKEFGQECDLHEKDWSIGLETAVKVYSFFQCHYLSVLFRHFLCNFSTQSIFHRPSHSFAISRNQSGCF